MYCENKNVDHYTTDACVHLQIIDINNNEMDVFDLGSMRVSGSCKCSRNEDHYGKIQYKLWPLTMFPSLQLYFANTWIGKVRIKLPLDKVKDNLIDPDEDGELIKKYF